MIKERPIFLTGVCLCLIVWGCYQLFTSFSNLKDPAYLANMDQIGLPTFLQVAMIYIDAIVLIASAVFMFQEANWARWVYLGWGFLSIDYHLYATTDWHTNILPIGFYLISALVLLVPSANRYFSNVIPYTDDFED
jgi:hypothetical protein